MKKGNHKNYEVTSTQTQINKNKYEKINKG